MSTQRVYKYELPMIGAWSSVTMPVGAEAFAVQVQHGAVCLWARITIAAPSVVHHFRIAGTGHDLGSNVGRHIDSFQLDDGALVFHVFAEATRTTP